MLESKDEHPRPRLYYHVLPLCHCGAPHNTSPGRLPVEKQRSNSSSTSRPSCKNIQRSFRRLISWIQQLYDDTMYTVYYNYNIIYLPLTNLLELFHTISKQLSVCYTIMCAICICSICCCPVSLEPIGPFEVLAALRRPTFCVLALGRKAWVSAIQRVRFSSNLFWKWHFLHMFQSSVF